MATNAVYKIYNGSAWVEYHLKTNAAQVTQTTGTGWRKFISAKVSVNGVYFSEITTGNDAGGASLTLTGANIGTGVEVASNYLNDVSNIADALYALDTAAKAAYDHTPSGVLTSSNYSTTLGSVYQAKHANLTSISGLSTSSTGLIKMTNGTASLDTNSYITGVSINGTSGTSFTLNGTNLKYNSSGDTTIKSAIDAKISSVSINGTSGTSFTLDASNLKMSSSSTQTISQRFSALENTINGVSNSYGVSMASNSSLFTEARMTEARTYTTITIETPKGSTVPYYSTGVLNGNLTLLGGDTVPIKNLKVGDSIFISEGEDSNGIVPDFWVSEIELEGGLYVKKLVLSILQTTLSSYNELIDVPETFTPSSHTHGDITNDGKITSTAVTSASGVVVINSSNQIKKVTDMASFRTIIGAGTSSLTLGGNGSATTASKSDHTHSISLATDSGTADVSLSHGGKYKLTAGGSSVVFTLPSVSDNDTKNTAGSTDSDSKLYLIGATSQAANPQTYSHAECYVGTDHKLYSYSGNSTIGSRAVNVNTVTAGTTEPSSKLTGDIWIDTNN